MSEATEISARIARLQEQISQSQAELATARREFRDQLAARLEVTILQQQQQLAQLETQLAQAQQRESLGTASTGQIVNEDRSGGVQNPAQPASVLTAEGRINPSNIETGTNAPTRTLEQTQGTSNVVSTTPVFTAAQVNQNLDATPANPTTSPGVGSARDDNTAPNSNTTQQIINSSFGERVIPQPNVLDAYSSYTYSLSWYLLTPQQYESFTTGSTNVSTWELLAQTGGASQYGRNQFFQLDYYMDNLIIESYTPGKASGLSHSATKFEFTVTEPNGITLINNLYNAVSSTYKKAGITDNAAYLQANYCMVIRFYGYDQNGNIVYPIKGQALTGYPNQPSGNAIVEKYYPFLIENLTFRLVSKVVEYHITCKPIPYQTAISYDRGSIPFQFELVGETVADVLVGKPVGTVYPTVDPGARQTTAQPTTTAPTPTPATKSMVTPQALVAASGTDVNLVTDQGMVFGSGGL